MGGERAHRCTLLRLSRNGKRLTDKLVEVSERGCLKAVLRRAQGCLEAGSRRRPSQGSSRQKGSDGGSKSKRIRDPFAYWTAR